MPGPQQPIEFTQRPDKPRDETPDGEEESGFEPSPQSGEWSESEDDAGDGTLGEIDYEEEYGPDYAPQEEPEETQGQEQGEQGQGAGGQALEMAKQMALKKVKQQVKQKIWIAIAPFAVKGCLIIFAIVLVAGFIGFCSEEKAECAERIGAGLYNSVFGDAFGKI